MGGAGSAVNEYLLAQAAKRQIASPRVLNIGIADVFIPHASHEQQLAHCGLDVAGVVAQIQPLLV